MLCVLGLLILLLLAVLLIPIRYRLFVSSKEEERIRLEGRITWAAFPLRINGQLIGKAYRVWIRSFGLYIYDSDYPLAHKRNTIARFILKKLGFDATDGVETEQEKKLRKTKEKVFFWQKNKEDESDEFDSFSEESDGLGEDQSDFEANASDSDKAHLNADSSLDIEGSGDHDGRTDSSVHSEAGSEEESEGTWDGDAYASEDFTSEEEPPKKDIYDHIMYFFDRLNEGVSKAEEKLEELSETCSRTWKNVTEKVREITHKLKILIERIRFVLKVLEQDCTHKLLKIWMKNLWKMFCHVLPTKCKGWVHFGFPDDPQKMGKILALCGGAYSLYGRNIEVRPDFTEKVIEGEVLIKGRIRIITMVFRVFRMIVNLSMAKVLWFIYKEKTGKNSAKKRRRRRRKRPDSKMSAVKEA